MKPSLDPALILAEALDADAPEQALDRYPEQRQALAPLLAAALELRALPEAAPSGEFRRTARARLLAKLPARPSDRLNSLAPLSALGRLWQNLFQARRPAFQWIVAGLLAVVVIGAGATSVAAESALPGETLYPVKRWMESAQVALTLNSTEAASLRLRFAARRLNEAAVLAQADQAEAAGEALADYGLELAQAQRHWGSAASNADAAALRAALAEQAALIEQLESRTSFRNLAALAEARNALREAAAALDNVRQPPLTTASGTPTPTRSLTPTGTSTRTPAPTITSTWPPTPASTLPPTGNWIVNCVPQPWPTSVAAPAGLPTCAPGTPPARWTTDLPATLTALPTSLPATLTARPPLPTRLQATLTALPTNLPATLTALPTRFALPTNLPATLTALPDDFAGTLTALPPRPNLQATPPPVGPTLVLPPIRQPRP
jgi:hypothetical protein